MVVEEGLEEFMRMPSLMELTRIGARMMLQVAIEEEVTACLERDYYERNANCSTPCLTISSRRIIFVDVFNTNTSISFLFKTLQKSA